MEHAALLRTAAHEIDELDLAISNLNEDKKAVYQNIKETVPPAEFRAWREAVKLRQKRRTDREKMDQHDSLVADMLHMLEQGGMKVATRVRVREATPAHDPITGEITTEQATASKAEAEEGGAHELVPPVPPSEPVSTAASLAVDVEGGATSPSVPPSTLDPGDVPPFLERRKRATQEEAAAW